MGMAILANGSRIFWVDEVQPLVTQSINQIRALRLSTTTNATLKVVEREEPRKDEKVEAHKRAVAILGPKRGRWK